MTPLRNLSVVEVTLGMYIEVNAMDAIAANTVPKTRGATILK